MPESVALRCNALPDSIGQRNLLALLEAQRLENVAIRATLLALGTKLDADVGVTDVNYNSTISANLGSANITT